MAPLAASDPIEVLHLSAEHRRGGGERTTVEGAGVQDDRAAFADEGNAELGRHDGGREGPRCRDRVQLPPPCRKHLRALADHRNRGERELAHRSGEKRRLRPGGLQQRQLAVRKADGEHEAWNAPAGPNIDDGPRPLGLDQGAATSAPSTCRAYASGSDTAVTRVADAAISVRSWP